VSPSKRLWPILTVLLLPAFACAEDFTRKFTGLERGKSYELSVDQDGVFHVSPLEVVVVGKPGPKPPPVDPDPDPFVEEVRKQTAAVLQAGGSRTTGAALSAVYSLVASGVADGSIALDKAFSATKAGSDAIMAAQADRDKWTKWRADISTALNTLQSQGQLATKEQIAGVLGDISKGLDKATGNTLEPRAVAKIQPGAEFAFDKDGKADGILDGIDLAKLIELVKLIVELLKLFGLGA
jgi:hypothetical protein